MPLIKSNHYNSDEEYVLTESEDELENNKISFNTQKEVEEEDSEDEVLGFEETDEDEESEREIKMNDSDIEGLDSDDGLPDERAWGKQKKSYYNTDYIDQDYGGWKDDAEDAEREEEEAKKLQQYLTSQLDDNNFDLDMFKEVEETDKITHTKEKIKTDLSKMSKEQKEVLFKKESPEFEKLVQDFKNYCKELEKIKPIIILIKQNKIPSSSGSQFILVKNQLMLNYCSNISFYLMLKAKRIKIQIHPIINRLVQCKKLLNEIEKTKTMDKEIDKLLLLIKNGTLEETIKKANNEENKSNKKTITKKLKLLEIGMGSKKKKSSLKRTLENSEETEILKKKKKDTYEEKTTESKLEQYSSDEDNDMDEEVDDNNQDSELTKRGITKQIEKNRGLTPHRKKELRNPRVKHRNKYRRALIRRKGMVRQVRTELSRYGGEASGIKANISKSIKFKYN